MSKHCVKKNTMAPGRKWKVLTSAALCGLLLLGSCYSHTGRKTVTISNPDIGGGKILLYTTAGEFKGAANVGNLPDMVTFLADGMTLVSANEGEPESNYAEDPQGSVSIITLDKKIDGLVRDVTTLTFDNIPMPEGVRIKPGASAVADLEPEYIAVNPDGTRAWVTLQENNAVAIVDLRAKKIMGVKPLGEKKFDAVDIDSKDGASVCPAPENILALYQPDTIAAYRVKGADFFVTANEGDDREYDAWEDYAKAASLKKRGMQNFQHSWSGIS